MYTLTKIACLSALIYIALFLLFPQRLAAQEFASGWEHLSSLTGDLPIPWTSTEQTSAQILDVDQDGLNDFVLSCRKAAPVLVWYKRTKKGWQRYVLEPELKTIEAGGAYTDIDGDGDMDLVYGQDWQGPEMWWWENPHPHYDANKPWIRHSIKTSGAHQHHDQAFGDFMHLGKPQLAYWNQGNNTLNLAFIPKDPKKSDHWESIVIFSGKAGSQQAWYPEGIAVADVDGDGTPDLLAGNLWFKYVGNQRFKAIPVAEIGGRIAAGKFLPGKTLQIITAPGDGLGSVKWYSCSGDPENSSNWVGHDLIGTPLVHGHTLCIADINKDGHLDVLVAEMMKWTESKAEPDNPVAKAYIAYGDGKGDFDVQVLSTGMDFHEAKIGDLDGDGDIDILIKPYNWNAPRIDVLLQRR